MFTCNQDVTWIEFSAGSGFYQDSYGGITCRLPYHSPEIYEGTENFYGVSEDFAHSTVLLGFINNRSCDVHLPFN